MPMLFTVAVAALTLLILVGLVACLRDDKAKPAAIAAVHLQPSVASTVQRVVSRPNFLGADASPRQVVRVATPQVRNEDAVSELREQIAQLQAEGAALKQEIRDLRLTLASTAPDRQDGPQVRLITARAA